MGPGLKVDVAEVATPDTNPAWPLDFPTRVS